MRPPKNPNRLDQAVTGVLIRLGGLAAIAVLIAAGVNVWRTALSSSADTYIAANQSLFDAHTGMLDQETGLRGYLSTGQDQFLQPYHDGQAEVGAGDSRLQVEVAQDTSLLDGYVAVRLAQDDWISKWASVAADSPGNNSPSFLAGGKQLFDVYRAAESRLGSNLQARIAHAQNASSIVGFGGLLVEFPIGVAGAMLWWRSRRRLRRGVVGPVSSILATLKRLEDGDFFLTSGQAEGPAELQEISTRLTAITVRLQSARDVSRRREEEAAQHAARLRRIVDMGREIAGSLNLRYVLQAVSHSVLGVGCGTRCVIWLTDDSHGTLVPLYDSKGLKGRVVGLEPVQMGDQVVGKAARFGRLVGPEPVSHPDAPEPWDHALAVPMIVGARVVGVIEVGDNGAVSLPNHVLELIDTLSSQAATAIEAARLYERAEHQSRTDALTLLPNRHDLDTTLANEVSRAERYGRSLAVAMLDLDHFKSVNDTFGHARGDDVLQETASVMRSVIRDVDTIYRYGGEEFLVVMPETSSASALELCERIRLAVFGRVVLPDGRRLTVSAGVAGYPDHAQTPATLVNAADEALYRAKHAGRDRVVASTAVSAAVPVHEPPRLVPRTA